MIRAWDAVKSESMAGRPRESWHQEWRKQLRPVDLSSWEAFTRQVRSISNVCRLCRMDDRPTNVHHWFYDSDREPWQYLFTDVLLLCQPCHYALHRELDRFKVFVFQGYMTPVSLTVLNRALRARFRACNIREMPTEQDKLRIVHVISDFFRHPDMPKRYAAEYAPHCNPPGVKDLKLAFYHFRRGVFRYFTPQSFRVFNEMLTVVSPLYDSTTLAYAVAELLNTPTMIEAIERSWKHQPKPQTERDV